MLNNESKIRFKKLLVKTAGILAVGIAYYLIVSATGWRLPCVFKEVTGLYCPGCGITRMFMSLTRLDFESALRNNMLVMILLIPGGIFALRRAGIYIKNGDAAGYGKTETILVIVAGVLAIVFWILRNMPEFSFLAPM